MKELNEETEMDEVDKYFKENNIKKPQEVIVAAACVVKNANDEEIIITGARHWDKIMRNIVDNMSDVKIVHEKQGFINQFGQYRTREESYKIVQENGQKFSQERNRSHKELYSEGVW